MERFVHESADDTSAVRFLAVGRGQRGRLRGYRVDARNSWGNANLYEAFSVRAGEADLLSPGRLLRGAAVSIISGVCSWEFGFNFRIELSVPFLASSTYPKWAFVGGGHMTSTAVTAKRSAGVTRALLAGFAVSIMLAEIMCAATSCAY